MKDAPLSDPELRVLYEDARILAVDKPPGLIVIPGRGEPERTLSELVQARFARSGRKPFVVHRIDRGTSGVVVFALSAEAHRELSAAFEHRIVRKGYIAVVEGTPDGNIGRIDTRLHGARRGKMRPADIGERGVEAVTDWKLVESFERYSLVELQPKTGRTHQIRVHLRSIGHPLAVDPLYGRKAPLTAGDLNPASAGPDEIVLDRTPLHASWLLLPAAGGTSLRIDALLPGDMARTLELLGHRFNRPSRPGSWPSPFPSSSP